MPHELEVIGDLMVVKVDPNGDMDALNRVMNEVQDGWAKEIESIGKTLKVSDGTAGSIWYLRTRARWTQELENQLIAADHAGVPVDEGSVLSGEWPPDHVSPLASIVEE